MTSPPRPSGLTVENSAPRTSVMPDGLAPAASAQPAVVSWSVSASTVTPAPAAVATSSVGVSVPSETVEWVWRSITAHAEDQPQRRRPRAPPNPDPGRVYERVWRLSPNTSSEIAS